MPHTWWTKGEGLSKLTPISVDDFGAVLNSVEGERSVREIIVHHTWSPRTRDYRGRSSWEGIQHYHRDVRGWSDIGYHVGVDPLDLDVWLLRPIERGGGHCLGHNAHSVGVVMLGNYDKGKDDPSKIVYITTKVVAALCERYSLTEKDVYFHRDFADKTCPGTAVHKTEFRNLVKSFLGSSYNNEQPFGDLEFRIFMEKNGKWIELVLVPNGDHRDDQGKMYVCERGREPN